MSAHGGGADLQAASLLQPPSARRGHSGDLVSGAAPDSDGRPSNPATTGAARRQVVCPSSRTAGQGTGAARPARAAAQGGSSQGHRARRRGRNPDVQQPGGRGAGPGARPGHCPAAAPPNPRAAPPLCRRTPRRLARADRAQIELLRPGARRRAKAESSGWAPAGLDPFAAPHHPGPASRGHARCRRTPPHRRPAIPRPVRAGQLRPRKDGSPPPVLGRTAALRPRLAAAAIGTAARPSRQIAVGTDVRCCATR